MSSHESDELQVVEQVGEFDDDYGEQQIYKCTNCNNKNSGYVEKEASFLTFLASIISLLIFRLYAVLILPLIIESTKTTIKKCVKCDHILEKQELMSMPSLNDKILKFACGNCFIVISRKYALVLIALLIGVWFFLPSHSEITNPGGLNLNTLKWENFVEDCGRKVIFNNGVRAKRNFETKYAGNIITWNGVLQTKIDRNRIDDPSIGEAFLIKMNPSDSKEEYPDIQLIFFLKETEKFKAIIDQAQPGDVVKFKAIMRKMGDEFHYHHFEAQEVSLTGEKVDMRTIPMIEYVGNIDNKLRREKPDNALAPSVPAVPTQETQTPQNP